MRVAMGAVIAELGRGVSFEWSIGFLKNTKIGSFLEKTLGIQKNALPIFEYWRRMTIISSTVKRAMHSGECTVGYFQTKF